MYAVLSMLRHEYDRASELLPRWSWFPPGPAVDPRAVVTNLDERDARCFIQVLGSAHGVCGLPCLGSGSPYMHIHPPTY